MTHPLISFLNNFIHILNQKGVVIAPLRYKLLDEYNAFSGDYDYITSDTNVDKILQTLFQEASDVNLNFTINRIKYGKLMIYLHSPVDDKTILLEIWTHLDVKSDNTLGYIFFEDIQSHISTNKDGSSSLSLELESLYYISHLKSKNKKLDVPLIQTRLYYYSDFLKSDFFEYYEWYQILIREPSKLNEIAKKANNALVEKEILYTNSNSEKASKERTVRIKISKHRIYSQFLKAVKITPVVGPDGVGKTSIIEAIKLKSKSKIKYYRFKNLFRHNMIYQITSYFLRKKLDSKIQKNQYDDIYGSLIIRIGAIRFPLLAIMSFFSNKFYFTDRFFHDFIIQDTRFLDKKAKLRENYKDLLSITPNSFWFLHLDAPTDVILSRKDELNSEAIDSYRDDIFKLYLEKSPRIYTYINTSLPIENCVGALMQISKNIGIKEK